MTKRLARDVDGIEQRLELRFVEEADVEARFDLGSVHLGTGIGCAPSAALGEVKELVEQDERISPGLGRLTGFLHRCHQVLHVFGTHLAQGQGPEGWKEMRLEGRAIGGEGGRLPADDLQVMQQSFADCRDGGRSAVLRRLRVAHQTAQLCLGFGARQPISGSSLSLWSDRAPHALAAGVPASVPGLPAGFPGVDVQGSRSVATPWPGRRFPSARLRVWA